MKKRVMSIMMLIMVAFMFGFTDRVWATNMNSERGNTIIENEVINTTSSDNNTLIYGVDSNTDNFINDINDHLQNMTYTPKKDNRKAVTVTIIIIVTVAIIAALVGWYYMTNQ